MYTIGELSRLAGVSVRTLRHYHAVGLLPPSRVTAAGYRLYDDAALERLQTILFFRELEFPLKEIGDILASPGFDRRLALEQQLELLRRKRRRLDKLISLARKSLQKGESEMDFTPFDKRELEAYAAEAKARWGDTAAYRAFAERPDGNSPEAAQGLVDLLAEIGKGRGLEPHSQEAQALVEELQEYITRHYYPCTPEILQGLGQMYVADPRFRENIDAAGGPGTAEFLSRAIAERTEE